MRRALVFEASRDGYGIDQIARNAMTVGDLLGILQDFDEDTLVVLSHDNGYTYGSLPQWYDWREENDDGEWESIM